jgi:hypothetical protein
MLFYILRGSEVTEEIKFVLNVFALRIYWALQNVGQDCRHIRSVITHVYLKRDIKLQNMTGLQRELSIYTYLLTYLRS